MGETVPAITAIVPLRPIPEEPGLRQMIQRLCEQTIRSLLNKRTAGKIRVWVICHEIPSIPFNDEVLEFVSVPFAKPDVVAGESGMVDKWKKLQYALIRLRDDSTPYFMFVDADDLISWKIIDHVASHRPANGMMLKAGYSWRINSPWLFFDENIPCGSNSIIETKTQNLPIDMEDSSRLECISLCNGHSIIERAMSEAGMPLQLIEEPKVIYTSYGGQHSKLTSGPRPRIRERMSQFKFRLLRLRLMTRSKREEFGIDDDMQSKLKDFDLF